MTSTIKLSKFVSPDVTVPGTVKTAWPLTITASGTNMPSEIFVYQRGGIIYDPVEGDIFSCVVSPSQIEELPVTPGQGAFYRIAEMSFLCRSVAEADSIWLDVVAQVQLLVRDYNTSAAMLSESVTVSADLVTVDYTAPVLTS